jgi:hypothetical protein
VDQTYLPDELKSVDFFCYNQQLASWIIIPSWSKHVSLSCMIIIEWVEPLTQEDSKGAQ